MSIRKLGKVREENMNQLGKQIQPYALQQDEGWTYRFGIDFTVKVSEMKEASGAAVLEYITKKGEEPPDHTHTSEDEMFYVLEGTITFRCGGETFKLKKGGFIFLPHGIEHGYTIRSKKAVRLLVITSPVREGLSGGWGGFVADMEKGQGELIAKPTTR
jgi:quercetin dioxygenase-like cupin family protein